MISKKFLYNNRIVLSFITILLTAAILRFFRLDSGLWLDEIITYVNYARLPFGGIITTFDSENQHFLYSIFAHLSFLVFGENAWALRLPAVLFGLGSIAVLYKFCLEVRNKLEALLAAALLTFSYHHIWFSQNARGYSGLLFWTIFSSWLLLRGISLKNNKLTWLVYAVACALGVYTHLTMIFVIVGQLCIYIFVVIFRQHEFHLKNWTGLWIGFGLMGIFVLILFFPVIPNIMATVGGSEASVVTEWKNPIWTILEIVKGLEIGFSGWFFAVVIVVVMGLGFISYAKLRPVVLGLLIIPPVIGAFTTLVLGHHIWPRFFFFALGFGSIVAIRGVMRLGEIITNLITKLTSLGKLEDVFIKKNLLGVVFCLGLIMISITSIPKVYGPKQDYGGAYNFITENLLPGDMVASVSLTSFVYEQFYQTNWQTIISLDELDNIRSLSKRTWLVTTFSPVMEATVPGISETINSDFKLIKLFDSTVEAGNISVYRSENANFQIR